MSASRARAREASARADAVAGGHGHLPPRRVVDTRVEFVAIAGLGLLGPVPQSLDLLAELARLAEPARRRVVEERVGRLLVGVFHLRHAQVVVAALEHGELRPPAEHRLDRVGEARQVVLDELVLQCQRGGGDDDRSVDQQRRGQIREGLARTGAGLDQEVLAVADGLFDGVRHRLLPGPRDAAGHRADRGAEKFGGGGFRAGGHVEDRTRTP
jgi:hypothetical protein